jgi:hypothetical protein
VGKSKFRKIGKIEGFYVTLHLCSPESLKDLADCHRNKSNTNYYPRDDSEIVADDRFTPAQENRACCVVMIAGPGLKFAKKKKVMYRTNKLQHRQGNHMIIASHQENTSQTPYKFGKGLILL